ncbi:MAG: 30S ribosomal protein S3ae [Candidatus Ranarchaeia archaeon]
MSKSRSRRGSTVRDKWRSKTWYEVYSPSYFNSTEIATSPAIDDKALKGRVFETTLYDLTDDFTKSHINLKFQVDSVKGNKAYTIFKGHELTRDYLRSLVRRGTSRIDGIFDVTTADNYKIRLRSVVFTHSRGNTSQQRAIRKIMAEQVNQYAHETPFEKFVGDLVNGSLAEKIGKAAKVIMPVRRVEIIKSTLRGSPKK